MWISGCAAVPTATNVPLRSPAVSSSLTPVEPINSVVVDPGHGGHDPGTSHFGLREKNLNLDICRRLRAVLRQDGFSPVMTRETDQFIPLSNRPGMANRLGADLFVSVHVNANRNRNVSGAEVYYPRESVVSSSAQWPPSISREDVSIPSLTIKQILWDLVLTRTRSHSRRLASAIGRSLREGLGVHCRGPKAARFVVLREAWMPAVLVEVGFVTNRSEAQRLGSSEYRQAVAEAIAKGVELYVREVGAGQV